MPLSGVREKGPDGVGRARVQAHQPCHQQVDVEHERAAASPVSLPSRGIRTVRSPSTRAADPASAGAAGRFAGCPCPELRAVGAQIFLRYSSFFSAQISRNLCANFICALISCCKNERKQSRTTLYFVKVARNFCVGGV